MFPGLISSFSAVLVGGDSVLLLPLLLAVRWRILVRFSFLLLWWRFFFVLVWQYFVGHFADIPATLRLWIWGQEGGAD